MESRGVRVLIAAAGVNFIAGLLYIWSVISKSLVNELGWSSKEASLPYTVATISFVIAMVVLGKVQDAKGPRVTATFGSVLIGLGLILSGLTTSPMLMILTFGIIGGIGIGTINVSAAPPPIKWFPPEKKGLIMGIVVAGVGISSAVFSPLANYLIQAVGISKTFIYIGIISLVVAVSLSQILQNPPAGYLPSGSSGVDSSKKPQTQAPAGNNDLAWNEVLKTSSFYRLWIMLGFSSSAGLMIIGHIANIAKVQVGWEGGFLLVILLAVFNTIGRLAGGVLSDKIGRTNLMKIAFIIQAVNMFMFSIYSSAVTLAIGVAVAGVCYGTNFSVFPAIISDLYGAKNFGMNYGLIFTSWGVGGVIGPMTAAAILDATQTYNTSYFVACALLAISALIAFTFKSPTQEAELADQTSN